MEILVKQKDKVFAIENTSVNKEYAEIEFRTYSLSNECGGFKTTYRFSFAPGIITKENISMFVGMEYEIKSLCKILNVTIILKKTNNIVPNKYRFENRRGDFK